VNFANGTQAEGTVRYIRREASDLTRTFPVEIAVPNPDLSIPSGMSAEITVDTQEIMSVIVPRSIITLGTDGTIGVRTLEADSKVSFLGVNIIDDTPEGLVVTGIPDGTRVVVSGQDLVTDGQDVVGIDASAAAGARKPGQN
jgi:multidrug efflux system membrane fusion protein